MLLGKGDPVQACIQVGCAPKGDTREGFSLCVLYLSSFSKLILKVQFEEPNLVVLFCHLCLAFLQSIQELKMTTKLSLCLWPLQVAGFFSLRFMIMFHLIRNINSFHNLHEVPELHFGHRHHLSCWFALCPPHPTNPLLHGISLLCPF